MKQNIHGRRSIAGDQSLPRKVVSCQPTHRGSVGPWKMAMEICRSYYQLLGRHFLSLQQIFSLESQSVSLVSRKECFYFWFVDLEKLVYLCHLNLYHLQSGCCCYYPRATEVVATDEWEDRLSSSCWSSLAFVLELTLA